LAAALVYLRAHAQSDVPAMIYAIAFRIKHDDTYEERLQSLVGVIRREAMGVWEELTSFMVIETTKTTDELAQTIYLDSEFDGDKDSLVVISLSYQHYVARGAMEHAPALAHLMSRR
jgi:hypothetical protein